MANTYTQLHIQTVFAVKYRLAVIDESWEDRLQKCITAILQREGHKLIAINNVKDHMHIFFGLEAKQSISNLMQMVKADSTKWINEKRFTKHKFYWQEGYGAFSYSRSHIDRVAKYVMNQKEHHKKVPFREEYHKMLKNFGVNYDERYTFKPLE
jgi:REP element-mobilizing transposase RayT